MNHADDTALQIDRHPHDGLVADPRQGQQLADEPRGTLAMAGKKVAILQSNYIPWKGYFDLIA
ncbi:MAG: hypothetical protein ACRDIE_05860, partial [Chloroflexota bacterium]